MILKVKSQTPDKIDWYWSERCLLSCQGRMAEPDVIGSPGDTGLKVNSWWILLLVRKSSFSFPPPTELGTRHQMLWNGHVRQCPKWVLEKNRCNCFVFVMVTDDLFRCPGIFWEKVHIAAKSYLGQRGQKVAVVHLMLSRQLVFAHVSREESR